MTATTHTPDTVYAATVLHWARDPDDVTVIDVRTPAELSAGVGGRNLHILAGGVGAYDAAGGQVVRGRSRWALDRQVRLTAGLLVLASILTSLRLPAACFLAGGVGAGLTYSALIDSCATGSLLSRLPFNRGPAGPAVADVLNKLPAYRTRP
ncbi:MAG: DUF2892 domain-containing protein [Nocardioides sp.]|nr:DUF2892 domain-containing protein [Nocardioides sp.]